MGTAVVELNAETVALINAAGGTIVTVGGEPKVKTACRRCGGSGTFSRCEAFQSRCFDCDVASGGKRIGWELRDPIKFVRSIKAAATRAKRIAREQVAREEAGRLIDARIAVTIDDLIATVAPCKAAQLAASPVVGKIGERLTLVAKLEAVKSFESRYGTRVLCIFRELETGARLVWWTTWGAFPGDMERGDEVKIVATVSEHGEYGDAKQTTVQRVKLVEVLKRAEG